MLLHKTARGTCVLDAVTDEWKLRAKDKPLRYDTTGNGQLVSKGSERIMQKQVTA